MHDEVRLYVRVAPDHLDVSLLRRAVDGFVELLRASGRGGWIVSELALGSITTAARPAADNDIDVDVQFASIVAGLRLLAEAPIAPADWSDEMLVGVAALSDVADANAVDGIELSFGDRSAVNLSTQMCENARLALDNGPVSLGAVTGRVDRFYSRGNRHELGLVDEATSDTVTMRYGRAHEDEVRELIGQRVTAWGLIRRTPGGKKRDMRLEGVKVAAPESEARVDDVVGILGTDWTEGTSSVDWVRSQRDD